MPEDLAERNFCESRNGAVTYVDYIVRNVYVYVQVL
jgi:hypothetical protein